MDAQRNPVCCPSAGKQQSVAPAVLASDIAAAGRTQIPGDVIELLDSSEDTGSVSRRRNKQKARDLGAIQVSDSSEESGRRRCRGLGKQPMLDLDLRLGVQTNGVHLASSSRAAASHRESESESLDKAVSDLLHLFPLLCPKVAASLLYPLMEHATSSAAVEKAVDFILENRIHETAFVHAKVDSTTRSISVKGDEHGVGVQTLHSEGAEYEQTCLEHLAIEFPRVRRPDLKDAWVAHGSRLGPTFKAIRIEYEHAISEDKHQLKANGSVKSLSSSMVR